MSTLSLADLGPKMLRELGLEAPCDCAISRARILQSIPVVEISGSVPARAIAPDLPGAAWLRTGLHRLRVPPDNVQIGRPSSG